MRIIHGTCVLQELHFAGRGMGGSIKGSLSKLEQSYTQCMRKKSTLNRMRARKKTCKFAAISSSDSLGMALRRMKMVPQAFSFPFGWIRATPSPL